MVKEIIEENSITIVCLAIALTLFIALFGYHIVAYNDVDYYTVTINDKNVKRVGDKDLYLIYTENANSKVRTFKVADSFFMWRWDSSDLYSQIQVGETYVLKTRGYRIPILSEYENIESVSGVE